MVLTHPPPAHRPRPAARRAAPPAWRRPRKVPQRLLVERFGGRVDPGVVRAGHGPHGLLALERGRRHQAGTRPRRPPLAASSRSSSSARRRRSARTRRSPRDRPRARAPGPRARPPTSPPRLAAPPPWPARRGRVGRRDAGVASRPSTSPHAVGHRPRTRPGSGIRSPSDPCTKGSGNAPTIAGTLIAAPQSR